MAMLSRVCLCSINVYHPALNRFDDDLGAVIGLHFAH